MREPHVNNGVSGPRNYDPKITKALEEEIARLKRVYPVSNVLIDLACTTDNRWKNYNGKENQKPEKV